MANSTARQTQTSEEKFALSTSVEPEVARPLRQQHTRIWSFQLELILPMKLAFSQLFFWKSYALRASWCCFHRTGPRYGARTPKRRPETSVGALYCALLPQNRALSCVVGCRGVSRAGHCARGAPKQKPAIIPDGLQIFPGCMCPCIRPECKQDCVCMICHTMILQWHKARKLWRVGVGKPACKCKICADKCVLSARLALFSGACSRAAKPTSVGARSASSAASRGKGALTCWTLSRA